jgi:hypothetical protein
VIISHLSRILPAQPGVCRVCRVCRAWSDDYPQCFGCRHLNAFTAVLPLALAVNPSGLQKFLYLYKSGSLAAEKAEAALLLLLDEMLPRHEPCLRQAAGVTAFDSVTFVPGTRERPNQPLHDLLLKSALAPRLEVMLARAEESSEDSWFRATGTCPGRTVILVDDTFTRGSKSHAAATALTQAGAASVAVVVLGRHFRPDFQRCKIYLDEANAVPFDTSWCAICDPRLSAPVLPTRLLPPS